MKLVQGLMEQKLDTEENTMNDIELMQEIIKIQDDKGVEVKY